MMVYKCKSTYPNGCCYRNVYSWVSQTKSVVRHRDISDNGSTLKGGMLSKIPVLSQLGLAQMIDLQG